LELQGADPSVDNAVIYGTMERLAGNLSAALRLAHSQKSSESNSGLASLKKDAGAFIKMMKASVGAGC
jgi:hypothetical protein